MTLGELIDLEFRFAEDRELDRKTLRERDREIGRHLFGESKHVLDNHEPVSYTHLTLPTILRV